jgi:hypothetical protein
VSITIDTSKQLNFYADSKYVKFIKLNANNQKFSKFLKKGETPSKLRAILMKIVHRHFNGRIFPGENFLLRGRFSGWAFQGKFYTGDICQNSYTKLFLLLLLYLSQLYLICKDIPGKFFSGVGIFWRIFPVRGRGIIHRRNSPWGNFSQGK